MCTVSMIGDHYRDKWSDRWPNLQYAPNAVPTITRAEFDELKREVAELKLLLKRAKKYDEDNNEPDCEIDEKMDLLRNMAELVGIDLDDVIGAKSQAPVEQSKDEG